MMPYHTAERWLASFTHMVVEISFLAQFCYDAQVTDVGTHADEANDILMAKLPSPKRIEETSKNEKRWTYHRRVSWKQL